MKFDWSKVFSLEGLVRTSLKIGTVLVLAFIFYRIGKWIIHRLLRVTVPPKRLDTLTGLLQNILKYFIFFATLAMVLREIGVDPISLIAGAGIIGIALGFGAQSLVKDVVSGFFILFEGVFTVGDFVCLHLTGAPDVFGLVEEIGLRATKVKSISGSVSTVPNGLISSVDSYPLGYVPYFINLVMPGELGKENIKAWLDSVLADLPRITKMIVEPPRLTGGFDLSDGRVLAKIKLGIVPSHAEIDVIVDFIKSRFKEKFDAEIPAITYKMSEGAFEKYRSFFGTSHPLA